MNHFCVLGDGAWGTAVATVLAAGGHRVTIWSRDTSVADGINAHHYNERYLSGVQLATTIDATTDIAQALHNKEWIFCAVPTVYMRAVLTQAQPFCTPDQRWVVLNKGIESHTLLLPSQIIADVLGYEPTTVIVSGPSFAHDLAHKQLTAVTVAGNCQEDAYAVAQLMRQDYCRLYVSLDPIGVQIAGAAKNVIALGMGILQGAGMTDNTQAFFLTRGLQEISYLVQAMGGQMATVYGLAGVGDTVLTTMGALSRNRLFGQRIGRGETFDAVVNHLHGVVPEGVNTVVSLYQLQQKYNLQLPLCTGVYRMLFEQLSRVDMLKSIVDD